MERSTLTTDKSLCSRKSMILNWQLSLQIMEEEDMGTLLIWTQERLFTGMSIKTLLTTTAELNMMFCQEEMAHLFAQIIEFQQLELTQRPYLIKKQLKELLPQSDLKLHLLPQPPLLIYSTLGKESRSQTQLERPTSFLTGNSGTAETICLSKTRKRLPSTLIREDKWLITRERRLTLCLLLTRRQWQISLKMKFSRMEFIVTLTSLQTSFTLTISSLMPKHGSILNNLSITLIHRLTLKPIQPKLIMCSMSISNIFHFASAEIS